MEDLVARCQRQLATFRIKELKDVLARMGITKQGKKQILLDKIMAVLTSETEHFGHQGLQPVAPLNKYASREEVAKAIDDIYRKMHGNGADDLASKGRMGSSLPRSDDHEEGAYWGEGKTRCPCGSSIDAGTMIQCDDENCGVWQHLSCVIIPEKEGFPCEVPNQFYCELCRIQRGDPFCVSLSHPLLPTRLTTSNNTVEGPSPLQSLEKQFQLSRTDQEIMQRPNHDLQVWCALLNDKVPFRMHWPAYSELRINDALVRVTNRPGQQLLGANGRDDGPGILAYVKDGINKISFSAYDARPFFLGVRIICRLTVQQVLQLVPSETKGEPFEAALARVRRCIGGGGLENDNGSDSDLEVVSDSVPVNLRCPMSGSRMKIAGRFKPCLHMVGFDLHTFIELNQRTRKWQCPICLTNYSLENLIIDPFFNVITTAMKNYDESVTEVEVKADGYWRPKLEGDARLQEPWRASDGSISVAASQHSNEQPPPLRPVKLEEAYIAEKEPLKIGIKRTQDGIWQVNRLTRAGAPTTDLLQKRNTPISQSSSATGSIEDNPSVNQLLSKRGRKEFEVDSGTGGEPVHGWHGNEVVGADQQPGKESEVIVLSDSEEEMPDDFNLGSSGVSGYALSENAGPDEASALQPDLLADEHISDPFHFVTEGVGHHHPLHDATATTSSQPQVVHTPLDFFAKSGNEMTQVLDRSNSWLAQSQYEFFHVNSDPPPQPIPNHNHGQGSRRLNPMQVVSQTRYGSSSLEHNEASGSVSQNYLASACNGHSRSPTTPDPSLHLFLPPQPARAVAQPSSFQRPSPVVNENVQDNWFTLRLGSGESLLDTENVRANNKPNEDEVLSAEERGQFAASVLLGMSANGNQVASKSKPLQEQQPRSHEFTKHRTNQRSRRYYRVESDSD